MKCTILGCSGSLGVPQLLCDCCVCTSSNPKNTRSRSSILIQSDTTNILVDATPDFRTQAFVNKISRVDAVLLTHPHADHIAGLDDYKPFTFGRGELVPTYMTEHTYEHVFLGHNYLFDDKATPKSLYKPIFKNNIIEYFKSFKVGDITIQPFQQFHAEITSAGFRFGKLAYSTDCTGFPDQSFEILQDLDIWIIDCLRYHFSYPHSAYETTLNLIEKVKPKQAILTHMAHEMDYDELIRILPKNVTPAYDGMVLQFL